MANFLKRFFLFFFPILACLFLISLLMPVAAFAHTMQSFTAESSHTSFYKVLLQAATPTPVATTVPVTPTATTTLPTPVPTATPTAVPTTAPTPTAVPTTPPATATPTAIPSPTPTTVPTPGPTATPTPGGNASAAGTHTALNALIFTMGGAGVLLVIVGVILYFVYSRSI
jgi:hypothetical protein